MPYSKATAGAPVVNALAYKLLTIASLLSPSQGKIEQRQPEVVQAPWLAA
jgi:hypothetical protein